MKVAIYLRKSRADEEIEKTLGEGETLSKHRKALLKFAKLKNFNIADIKEEIVSGDSLFNRPKMLELLKEVENNEYDGVLVMDIDRLGRGGMKDQGTILETFKNSHTLIITPQKTYNLDDDMDEEMTEFKTFFSRRELKTINRRMQGGRVRSVEEGNYIAANPPFGYDIDYIQKSRTLKINEHEAEIIKLIFKMYIEGNGAKTITAKLNELGYKTKNENKFESTGVLFIIKNPVYIGKVTWKKREITKSKDPNKLTNTKSRSKDKWIISNGKHKPIIDDETFNKAQEILEGRYHVPYQLVNGMANPLASIVICGVCGSKMILRKNGTRAPHIICTKKCGNKSSKFVYIEKAILSALKEYYNNLIVAAPKVKNDNSVYENQLNNLNSQLKTLNNQKLKLFDFLEQGVYDKDTFIERSNYLSEKMDSANEQIKKNK